MRLVETNTIVVWQCGRVVVHFTPRFFCQAEIVYLFLFSKPNYTILQQLKMKVVNI